MATRNPDEAAPESAPLEDPTAQVDVVPPAEPAAAPPPPPPVVPAATQPPPPVVPAAAPPPPVVVAEPASTGPVVPDFLEPVDETPAPATVESMYDEATPIQQVVYVHAPVPPRYSGNRGVGALIAVLAAVVYAVLLAGAAWVLQYVTTGTTGIGFLGTWDFYVPIAVFLIAFILLVLVVNRAGWAAHVFGSLLVGAAVYFGTIGIDLLVNWLAFGERSDFGLFLVSGFHIVAAVLAREVAVWFGAWIAARGRRVTERNAILRSEFDARLADFHAGNY